VSTELEGHPILVCSREDLIAMKRAAGRPQDLVKPRGVEVETAAGTRRFEGAGRDDAPRIVADLVAGGEQVYEVRVLRSTLEDVYVEAVS
jgi:ABC-2 type transport system ATP-binding protein